MVMEDEVNCKILVLTILYLDTIIVFEGWDENFNKNIDYLYRFEPYAT
jgi:hypothetical protein